MKVLKSGVVRATLVGALLFVTSSANADTIFGRPVTGIGSNTQAVPNCPSLEGDVCYSNPSGGGNGSIGFYIPLSSSASGTYGVTNIGGGKTAGTTSDYGDGTTNALTMYLQFSPINLPVGSASLGFYFTDLDLQNVNDPYGFFETVQFFSAGGNALTPEITKNGQTGTSPLIYSVSGDVNAQTIYFPNVTSIVTSNPFFVKLTFSSDWYKKGYNTSESLIAKLVTTPAPPAVPEPATLLLLSTGLAGVAGKKIHKRKSHRKPAPVA